VGAIAVVVTIAVGAGCAQLAGINDTSGNNRLVDSLVLERLSVGATLVRAPLELSGLQATYYVPNAQTGGSDPLPAGLDARALGTWTRDLPDPAPVEFTLPDLPSPVLRRFTFPARTLSVPFGVREHPGRAAAPDGAMLTVTTPLEAAAAGNETFTVYTVGSWSTRALGAVAPGAVRLGPVTYAFSTATSQSGRAELDRLTTQDAFLVLRYVGNTLTGVAEAAPFDQTVNDTPDFTSRPMAPVTQDQTLDVKVHPQTIAQRYMAVRPAVAGLALSWSVVAAPGAIIADNAGPALTSGTLTVADVGVTAKYGNPFATHPTHPWTAMLTLATGESRVYTPPTMTLPVTLNAAMNQFIEPSAGLDLTVPTGLPVLISIDTTQLTTDGQTIPQPTKPVEVTYIVDNPSVTLYSVQLFELVANTGAVALDRRLVFTASSNEAKFQLRPDLFQAGRTYTLRAVCQLGGLPKLADGDFTARELPLGQAYADSGVFTVTP